MVAMATTETDTTARLGALLAEVLVHAGQDVDRFYLIPLPGAPSPNGQKAAFYHAGPRIDEDADGMLHGTQLAVANTSEARRRHRVAAFTEIDWDDPLEEAVLAALLRHEVRHAEQFDSLGEEFFELYDLARTIGSWKVGGMPRSATLYGLIPAEMDANTAAAKFLRENRPGVVQAVLESDDGVLARSHTDPGPLPDLPTKMIAFIYLLREVADDPARSPSGLTFEDRLRYVNSRAAATWAALVQA